MLKIRHKEAWETWSRLLPAPKSLLPKPNGSCATCSDDLYDDEGLYVETKQEERMVTTRFCGWECAKDYGYELQLDERDHE